SLSGDDRALPGHRARRSRGAEVVRDVDHAARRCRSPARGGRARRMKRIGVISVHTCPLAALGGKETGGMNVYVREVARHLGRLGLPIAVCTRTQTPGVPPIVPLGWGARVVHIDAGPQRPVPPPEIVTDLDEFTEGVVAFQRRS